MIDPLPGFHPSPTAPRERLPARACDSHCHVFGPASRFPFAADAPFRPADAPKERLFALHALLGVERCTIVQSTCHGYDNSVVADAIAARRGAYCGIALVPLDVSDHALRSLDAQGFRGARFNFMQHLGSGAPVADVIAFTQRLVPLGWHLQVHFAAALIDELSPWLIRSSVPVVVDHMARIEASAGIDQRAFRSLCALLRSPKLWVKVSGVDRSSRNGPPYADALPLARALVGEFGERVVWGTDWPHPNHHHVPDDGVLADLIAEIAPTAPARQALLVDNPQRLYRFPVSVAGLSPAPTASGHSA
jgi:2-pyrone-4,6-dicarboxylate lactonase